MSLMWTDADILSFFVTSEIAESPSNHRSAASKPAACGGTPNVRRRPRWVICTLRPWMNPFIANGCGGLSTRTIFAF